MNKITFYFFIQPPTPPFFPFSFFLKIIFIEKKKVGFIKQQFFYTILNPNFNIFCLDLFNWLYYLLKLFKSIKKKTKKGVF